MVSKYIRYTVVVLLLVGVLTVISLQMLLRRAHTEHTQDAQDNLQRVTMPTIPSMLSDIDEYSIVDAVKLAKPTTLRSSASVVVVPHHLVAADALTIGIQALKDSSVVFLLSPDHFNGCSKSFCTTYGEFQTFFGKIETNIPLVEYMSEQKEVALNPNVFNGEHGIHAVTPFIRHYMQEATIVPIVVSQNDFVSKEDLRVLARIISESMKKETVTLIVSSDFSHYKTMEEADALDEQAKNVLITMNGEDILTLNNPAQSDCPNCLWVANEVAHTLGNEQVSFLWHSNSARLLGNNEVKETTSHFVVLYE